uniref:Putative secreted protein n=1 Tax=Lutzomyia longipalpis TaxID=7200 RepID=A0A7G3AM71_LUTLO
MGTLLVGAILVSLSHSCPLNDKTKGTKGEFTRSQLRSLRVGLCHAIPAAGFAQAVVHHHSCQNSSPVSLRQPSLLPVERLPWLPEQPEQRTFHFSPEWDLSHPCNRTNSMSSADRTWGAADWGAPLHHRRKTAQTHRPGA